MFVESATDGTATLHGFCGPIDLDFVWGDGEVNEVLEVVAGNMKMGERAVVTCTRPSLCRDAKLGLQDIRAKSVVFTIELLHVEGTADVEAMGPDSKIEFALARKDVGGRLFKEQRYRFAYERYSYLDQMFHNANFGRLWSGEQAKKAEELQCVCQLNMAACLLKLDHFKGVISVCDRILSKHPHNTKALFRRASAYHGRADYVPAVQDLNKLLDMDPSNNEAKRLLQQVKQAQREVEKYTKDVYAKMCAVGK